MSRGFGWVQMACLDVIRKAEAADKWLTTYNIAAEVYRVKRDKHGNRWISDAQHVAIKRALEGLQRKGQIIGFRTWAARDPNRDWRVELCHHWMTERQARKWLAEHPYLDQAERVIQKMRAIGMQPCGTCSGSGQYQRASYAPCTRRGPGKQTAITEPFPCPQCHPAEYFVACGGALRKQGRFADAMVAAMKVMDNAAVAETFRAWGISPKEAQAALLELGWRIPQTQLAYLRDYIGAQLNWNAECNLDHGGTENAPNNFTADCGEGQYFVDVRIRRSRGSIDLSRPRFRARWVIDRSLVKDDGLTPSSNMKALGTFATEGEAKAACEQHAKQATG